MKSLLIVLTLISIQVMGQTSHYFVLELRGQIDVLGNSMILSVEKPMKHNPEIDSIIRHDALEKLFTPNNSTSVLNKFENIGWHLVTAFSVSAVSGIVSTPPFTVFYLKKEY